MKTRGSGSVAFVVRGVLGCAALALVAGSASSASAYTGPATLSAPVCGSLLTTGDETFSWDEVGAGAYGLWIGSGQGGSDAFRSARLVAGTTTVPTPHLDPERQYWVRVRSLDPVRNRWQFSDCTIGPRYVGPAAISSPRCGDTLDSRTPTFAWPDVGASDYAIRIGSAQGSYNYYRSENLGGGATSVTIPGEKPLPADGRPLWVRLRSRNPNTNRWQIVDCQVSAVRPDLVAPGPTCGDTLTSSSPTLFWSANGNEKAEQIRVRAGTTVGGKEFGESAFDDPATSLTLNGVPGDGSFVFVRFQWRKTDGSSSIVKDCRMLTPTFAPPALVAPGPVCEGTLDGATTTLHWAPGAWQIKNYGLQVGSTPGGNDYFDDTALGTATSAAVSNLPTDGRLVHVRLRYEPDKIGRTLTQDCVVTAAGAPQVPQLTGPTCGGRLPGSHVDFDWDPRDVAVDRWQLLAGSSLGGQEYFASDMLPGSEHGVRATGIPRDGRALFVRLRWRSENVWKSTDCPYTAFRALNLTSEGAAERTSSLTCTTTNSANGKPMPIAKALGCVDTSCAPPDPPPVPAVPGNLTFPTLNLSSRGSPDGDPFAYAGSWSLSGNYVSECDGKRTNESLATGAFSMKQDEGTGTLSGKLTTIVVPGLFGCSYTCASKGNCTLSCPDAQNLKCAVTCTPETDFCDRDSTVSGVVAGDGSISLSITHQQQLDYDCGTFGKVHIEDRQGQVDDPETEAVEPTLPGLEFEFPAPERIVN